MIAVAGSVLADVALIWANCQKFNEPTSELLPLCTAAKADFEQRWRGAGLPTGAGGLHRNVILDIIDLLWNSTAKKSGRSAPLKGASSLSYMPKSISASIHRTPCPKAWKLGPRACLHLSQRVR